MKSTHSKTNKQTKKSVGMGTNSFSNYLALRKKGTSAISKGKARMNKPADLLSLSYRQCMKGNDITPVKKKLKKNNTEQVFEVATLIYYKAMKMNVSKKDVRFFFF